MRPFSLPLPTRLFRKVSIPSFNILHRASFHVSTSPSTDPAILKSFLQNTKFLRDSSRFGKQFFDNLTIRHVEDGKVQFSIPVDSEWTNYFGTLHGGVISTLVDIGGTLAILAAGHPTSGSSVEMNMSFLAAAKANEILDIKADCMRAGNRIAFTTVQLAVGDRIVAVGRHTKYYKPKKDHQE